MNFLFVLTIVSFLIATVLSMDAYGGGKCYPATSNGVAESNYETIPSEGDLSETEGYRKRRRMRLRAKRLRMKALKKRKLAKKARKAKKVRRVVKKNKH